MLNFPQFGPQMLIAQFSDIILPLRKSLFKGNIMKKPRVNYEDYVGKKINKWTILAYIYLKKRMHFSCICECGNKSIIQASNLIKAISKCCIQCAPKKHGKYKTAENRAWSGARNRCFNQKNKDYIHYGARGITMCERWNDFENFFKDMGPKPKGFTLDRIDNNGNYEPNNCRWATYSQQNSNQRKRPPKIITGGN